MTLSSCKLGLTFRFSSPYSSCSSYQLRTVSHLTASSSSSPLAAASTSRLFNPSSGPYNKKQQQLRADNRTIMAAATSGRSVRLSLGNRAPEFQLPEPLTGKVWKLEDFDSYPALLVMFICNHCPYVKHLKKDFVRLADQYKQKNLAIVAISSNSSETHPQDGPQFIGEEAREFGYPFPYLYDESQDVARAFGAVCTPEFFLFSKDGRRPFELYYHGQYDDSRPGNKIPVTGRDLNVAIDSALSGQQLAIPQKPSVGCSIKWHPTK